MPLDPQIEEWLTTARTAYGAGNAAREAIFDKLTSAIRSQPGLVTLLNDILAAGLLTDIKYNPGSVIGRSGCNSSSREPVLSRGSLSALRVNRKSDGTPNIASGTIELGDDLFQIIASQGAWSTLTPAQAQATALFVIAHEAGHAKNAAAFTVEYTNSINAGLTYITAQQAAINALPAADRVGKAINITDQLRNFLDVSHREEGRASIFAYTLAQPDSDIPPTYDDIRRFFEVLPRQKLANLTWNRQLPDSVG